MRKNKTRIRDGMGRRKLGWVVRENVKKRKEFRNGRDGSRNKRMEGEKEGK